MASGNPSHYKVSELKSRILHLAQTSVYHVKISPTAATLNFVKSEGRDITAANISNIELLCSDASLPGSSIATHECLNDRPGVTEKMAYRRIYDETIDLTFYVDSDYNVIEFFDGWMNHVTGQGVGNKSNKSFKLKTQSYRMTYPELYKGDLFLKKYEKDTSRTFRTVEYHFIDVFPTNIVSSPISYNTSEILKYTASFTYSRYVRGRVNSRVAGEFEKDFEEQRIIEEQRTFERDIDPSTSKGDIPRTTTVGVIGAGTFAELNQINSEVGW